MPIRALQALAVAVLISTSCSGGTPPSSPSETSDSGGLALKTGPQYLLLTGFDFSVDPLLPPCEPVGVPKAGKSVTVLVTLTHDGPEWFARSVGEGADNVNLRFTSDGGGLGGVAVKGSVTGLGTDAANSVRPARDITVRFEGVAPASGADVQGLVSHGLSYISGRISGAITFGDSKGASSHCSAISWSLQPTSGAAFNSSTEQENSGPSLWPFRLLLRS